MGGGGFPPRALTPVSGDAGVRHPPSTPLSRARHRKIADVTTLTVIGKPDCHLCDVAQGIVEAVVAEFPENEVVVEHRSIVDDPALHAEWWEKIPVVLIDGRLHTYWRVSADRLSTALREAKQS